MHHCCDWRAGLRALIYASLELRSLLLKLFPLRAAVVDTELLQWWLGFKEAARYKVGGLYALRLDAKNTSTTAS